MILRLLLCLVILSAQLCAQPMKILVSIKPLYGLIAKITKDTDVEIDLLYTGQSSPHTTGLTLDGAAKIKNADLIFWAGAIYETAIKKHMEVCSNAIDLSKTKNLLLLPYRTFDGKESSCNHDHGDDGSCDHHHHDASMIDGHYWLDIDNAIMMVKEVARILGEKMPEKTALIQKNCDEAVVHLTVFGKDLKAKIKPVPYISFHDFTQYFDHYFGTFCTGVVVTDPHHGASIQHLEALIKTMTDKNVTFVIKEKQFKGDILSKLEAHGVVVKTLDYLGADLNPDGFVYERIMTDLVEGFIS
ncbi:MAG: zinc ABC transporter substrate-binding protein [Alphaproteobacteria bacterium]|nr:zinc ABC transporter substrate-binding protein [Alphaproteobacteria bacterium]